MSVSALKLALELYHVPSRVRATRAEPLPDDVHEVLQIAAGSQETIAAASVRLQRPEAVIRSAASFFIEQVLLAPEADSYRILGSSPETSSADLRRNMALLLRALHPDHGHSAERSMFANRVVAAWEDLKTPERRQAYDKRLAASAPAPRKRRRSRSMSQSKLARMTLLDDRATTPGARPPSAFLQRVLRFFSR